MGDARIRLANERDARPIAEVGFAAWDAAYRGIMPDELLEQWTIQARIKRMNERWRMHDPEYRMWVLEESGRVVAYSASGLARDHESIPIAVGEIYSFYVHPSHWRRGHGRLLMEHVIADLFSRGFRETHLWTLADNEGARRFYEALGFSVFRERVPKQLQEFVVEQTRYRIGEPE